MAALNEKTPKPLIGTGLRWLFLVVGLVILGILCLYYLQFGHLKWGDTNAFGTFGDYIGGTLNPLFGLLTIFLLLRSMHIQVQELNLTRLEIQQARLESEKSRQAQEEQAAYQQQLMQQQILNNHLLEQQNGLAQQDLVLQSNQIIYDMIEKVDLSFNRFLDNSCFGKGENTYSLRQIYESIKTAQSENKGRTKVAVIKNLISSRMGDPDSFGNFERARRLVQQYNIAVKRLFASNCSPSYMQYVFFDFDQMLEVFHVTGFIHLEKMATDLQLLLDTLRHNDTIASDKDVQQEIIASIEKRMLSTNSCQ